MVLAPDFEIGGFPDYPSVGQDVPEDPSMEGMRDKILEALDEVFSQENVSKPSDLNDSSSLLEMGLDSLGLAILVAKLETKVGFDPFVISEKPYYPTKLGEFISFYEEVGRGL